MCRLLQARSTDILTKLTKNFGSSVLRDGHNIKLKEVPREVPFDFILLSFCRLLACDPFCLSQRGGDGKKERKKEAGSSCYFQSMF